MKPSIIQRTVLICADLFALLCSLILARFMLIEIRPGIDNISLHTFGAAKFGGLLLIIVFWYQEQYAKRRPTWEEIRLLYYTIFMFALFHLVFSYFFAQMAKLARSGARHPAALAAGLGGVPVGLRPGRRPVHPFRAAGAGVAQTLRAGRPAGPHRRGEGQHGPRLSGCGVSAAAARAVVPAVVALVPALMAALVATVPAVIPAAFAVGGFVHDARRGRVVDLALHVAGRRRVDDRRRGVVDGHRLAHHVARWVGHHHAHRRQADADGPMRAGVGHGGAGQGGGQESGGNEGTEHVNLQRGWAVGPDARTTAARPCR